MKLSSQKAAPRARLIWERSVAFLSARRRLLAGVASRSPLTLTGFVVVTLLLTLNEHVGKPHNDRIIRVACATVLIAVATCAACVMLAALMIRLRRSDAASRRFEMVVGAPYRVRHAAVLPRWLPLVQIDVFWEVDCAVSVETSADREGDVEVVTAYHRGEAKGLVRRYRVSDVLGLTRWVVRRKSLDSAVIRPMAGPEIPWNSREIGAGEQTEDTAGTPQGDLVESRRYEAGDPLRLILWKVYARSGQVLVRAPERNAAPQQKTMAYFIAGEGDEPTAAAACGLFESGCLGDAVWFQSDGGEHPVETPQEAVDQIVRSVNAGRADEDQMLRFLDSGARRGMRNCILFVPSISGHWVERVAMAAASFPGTCQIVLGANPVLDQGGPPSMIHRLFVRSDRRAASRDDWKTIVRRLNQVGLKSLVFDPVGGRELIAS